MKVYNIFYVKLYLYIWRSNMILGIIGAMSEELEILLKDMKLEKVEEKAKMKF